MAERVGRGDTLGLALMDAFLPPARGRSAVGWHARLVQLTNTGRGQDILAGYTPAGRGGRKWLSWLAQDVTPNKASQAAIDRAYGALRLAQRRDRLPDRIDHGRQAKISGLVAMGTDVRARGTGRYVAIKVAHRTTNKKAPVRWDTFDTALRRGTPAQLATAYIDHVWTVDENYAGLSDPPAFPGSDYTIEVV